MHWDNSFTTVKTQNKFIQNSSHDLTQFFITLTLNPTISEIDYKHSYQRIKEEERREIYPLDLHPSNVWINDVCASPAFFLLDLLLFDDFESLHCVNFLLFLLLLMMLLMLLMLLMIEIILSFEKLGFSLLGFNSRSYRGLLVFLSPNLASAGLIT